MKRLLVFLILLGAIDNASAQKPWRWTPLKGPNTGSHTSQLLIGANGEIISVGNAGYYSTINDGISWEYHVIIPQINYRNYNANYVFSGLVISSTGEYYFYFGDYYDTANRAVSGVYHSTDKGTTWKQTLKGKIVFGMHETGSGALVISAAITYSYGYSYIILQSIDKGNSWTQICNGGGLYPIAYTNTSIIYKLDQNESYFDNTQLSSCSSVRLFSGTNYNDTIGLIVLSDNSILAYVNSHVLHSFNAAQWDTAGKLNGIVMLQSGADNIYALALPEPNTLRIASSSDQGRSWSALGSVSPYVAGDKYSFFAPNRGTFLYENDTALYLSRDQGSSWKEIGLPFDSVNTVIVSDQDKIFTEPVDRYDQANYRYDYFDARLSSDKGETWYKSEPANVRITGIGKGTSGSILAIAPDSNEAWNSVWIFDTAEKSQWQRRSSVQHVLDHPLMATDGSKSTYLATNDYRSSEPTIYRSDDNGFSWIDIEAPNTGNDIFSLDASTDGTLYFGSYPVMYRSDDRGATWIKLLPVTDIVKLTAIKTFGTAGVLLGTEGDGLLLSNDKGNSWSRIDGKNFDMVTCLAVTSSGEVAAGTNRGLWISDSSRKNWTKVLLGKEANYYIGAVDVSKTDDFYIGTYGSSVWMGTRHYNGTEYVRQGNSELSVSPSPASESITINFDVPRESQLKLELYDILGRKLATIAEGKYSGVNRIPYRLSSISPGIYTLILSGSSNEAVKIIIR